MDIATDQPKPQIVEELVKQLRNDGFTTTEINDQKPWGAYIRIADTDIQAFISKFFAGRYLAQTVQQTPKILLVSPKQRLSWQYHFRRQEIWTIVKGPVAVARSKTDDQVTQQTYKTGDIIELEKQERHRLIGLEEYGIVAEIWQHTDPRNPSDENDIIRVSDDYERN